MEPRLSIIIPTKNRQRYCLAAVKQILSLGMRDFEICVQDNSDENTLEQEITSLGSHLVKYNYHKGVLSFVDNFSEAVSLCSGKYACMIGDDDGLLSSIENIVEYANSYDVDAIIPELGVAYYWPTDKPLVPGAENGYLITTPNPQVFKYKTVSPSVNGLLKNGGQDYHLFNLPKLYHGIVKRERLEDIKNVAGHYFGGLTPDIYIAVSLALVCKTVCKVNASVTISGVCPTSGSADSDTGRHTGSLDNAPHFRGHETYNWCREVPYVYSIETIWADTLLHVFEDFKVEKSISVSMLDAICYYKYPQLRTEIQKHINEYNLSHVKLFLLYSKYWLSHFMPRVIGKIKRILNLGKPINIYYDVYDIEAAYKLHENNTTI